LEGVREKDLKGWCVVVDGVLFVGVVVVSVVGVL
jgi:hypothetical protein